MARAKKNRAGRKGSDKTAKAGAKSAAEKSVAKKTAASAKAGRSPSAKASASQSSAVGSAKVSSFPLKGYALIIGLFALVLGLGLLPFQFMKQYKADDHVVYFLYLLILGSVILAALYDRLLDYLAARFTTDEAGGAKAEEQN